MSNICFVPPPPAHNINWFLLDCFILREAKLWCMSITDKLLLVLCKHCRSYNEHCLLSLYVTLLMWSPKIKTKCMVAFRITLLSPVIITDILPAYSTANKWVFFLDILEGCKKHYVVTWYFNTTSNV